MVNMSMVTVYFGEKKMLHKRNALTRGVQLMVEKQYTPQMIDIGYSTTYPIYSIC